MDLLRSISFVWALAHILLLFLFLFRSRYSVKKTTIITVATMGPLILLNLPLCYLLDADTYGILMLLTLSLPSLIVFWLLAKRRDGRFFFTFCLADTIGLEIIYVTQILNHYVTPDSALFLFASRLLIYPLLCFLAFRYLRPIYQEVQDVNQHGWSKFALIGLLFYVTTTLMMNYPTSIIERPAYFPALILMFILMPTIYLDIIATLRRQLLMHKMAQQESILKLQAENVIARVEELADANERFREERHNYRHKMKTIATLVQTQQYDTLEMLMDEYTEAMQKTQIIRYCHNAVIDAVLSAYIRQAEGKQIRVVPGFAFPNPIPVNTTELATVLANALENAIHACEKLPPEKRVIEIKVLDTPRFMVMIRNSFNGEITFNDKGIPVNEKEGHGFGTRTLIAFCEKHNAFYEFEAEDQFFTVYLNF